jgi:hypothetical protein
MPFVPHQNIVLVLRLLSFLVPAIDDTGIISMGGWGVGGSRSYFLVIGVVLVKARRMVRSES